MDTNRLEDGGRVVVDGVDAGTVLEHEKETTDQESPLDLAVAADSQERLPESKTDSRSLLLVCSIDKGDFLNNVKLVACKLADPAKVLQALLTSALGEKPARSLLDPDTADQEKTTRDQLNGKGDKPLLVVRGQSLADSVVDPETDKTTDLPPKLVDTDETATDSWRGNLRDVDGDLRVISACSMSQLKIKSGELTIMEDPPTPIPARTLPA